MSNWKKAMICIFVCIEIYFIFAFAFKYKAMLYLTVYGDELIKNVFDEIYYSEMHPAFFKYTDTDLRNLREVIGYGDTIGYDDDNITIVYKYYGDFPEDGSYFININLTPSVRYILMFIYEITDDYKIVYFYDYDIEKKVLTYYFHVASYSKNGKEIDRKDDIDAFFEETGLSYDYIRTQQELELDVFLDVWFEENEGLSRFNPDDLGDFTVEDVGIQGLRR